MSIISEDGARKFSPFASFLPEGKHVCKMITIKEIEGKVSKKSGIVIAVEIIKSDNPTCSEGTEFQIGFIDRGYDYALHDFQKFVQQAFGKDQEYVQDYRNLTKVVEKGDSFEGNLIDITGSLGFKSEKGKQFYKYDFSTMRKSA